MTPNFHPVLIRASALLLPMRAYEARGCIAYTLDDITSRNRKFGLSSFASCFCGLSYFCCLGVEVKMAKAGFGGGCHWCTEGVFQALRGVAQVDQGFLKSDAPADTWSEGVVVTFDPSVIPLAICPRCISEHIHQLECAHFAANTAVRSTSLKTASDMTPNWQ